MDILVGIKNPLFSSLKLAQAFSIYTYFVRKPYILLFPLMFIKSFTVAF